MTAPCYVATRWDASELDAPGLPIIRRTGTLISDQTQLDEIRVIAGVLDVDLLIQDTPFPGYPDGPQETYEPYVRWDMVQSLTPEQQAFVRASIGAAALGGGSAAAVPFTVDSRDGDGKITSITYHTGGGDVTTTYTYGLFGVASETTDGTTITFDRDSDGKLTGAH